MLLKNSFKTYLLMFLVFLGIFIPFFVFGAIFSDNFNSYNVGDLNGQDSWSCISGSAIITDTRSNSAPNGVKTYTETSIRNFNTPSTSGEFSIYFYGIDSENTYILIRNVANTKNFSVSFNDTWWGDFVIACNTYVQESNLVFRNVVENVWHKLKIKFGGDLGNNFQLSLDDSAYSKLCIYTASGAGNFDEFRFTGGTQYMWWDDILDCASVYCGGTPTIFGISPVSETEITSLTATFEFGYSNFNWDTSSGYAGFVVNFRDYKIGAVAKSIQYLKNQLMPNGTGTETINLNDFEIDKNGTWHFTGLGFGTHLDIEGGMFLTGRGYVDFWTEDLATPDYNLIFNIAGLTIPYTFSTPTEWYSENITRFDTPTDFFIAFVGFLTPIFEKVGEFGVRVQDMFDQNEAYDRGYALGGIFPFVEGYVQKIDIFFGGFPLTNFFKYSILIMLAIFIVNAVMKFIPFFG